MAQALRPWCTLRGASVRDVLPHRSGREVRRVRSGPGAVRARCAVVPKPPLETRRPPLRARRPPRRLILLRWVTTGGGGGGIRTHGRLPDTRFPVVPIRLLSHPSEKPKRYRV